MRQWVLLHYRVPPNPSARRVYVWRKLKKLGALLLHDSVWVLPDTAWTHEQFQWLAAEIGELEGDVMLWQARLALPGQEQGLVDRFIAACEQEYQPLWEALQQDAPDRSALARQFQEIRRRDYFGCALGQRVYAALSSEQEE